MAETSDMEVIRRKTKALQSRNTLNAPLKKYGEQFRTLYFSSGNIPLTKSEVMAKSSAIRRAMITNLFRQGNKLEINYLNAAIRKSIPCHMTPEDIKDFNLASSRIQKDVTAKIAQEKKMGKKLSIQRRKDMSMDF